MMSSSEEGMPWISEFCEAKGNEIFAEVDESFIRDSFNLTGLNEKVLHFREALYTILDLEQDDDVGLEFIHGNNVIEKSAEKLYGLIHARYILTSQGMAQMRDKYEKGEFGSCPKVYCDNQALLPIGLYDTLEEGRVKMHCPKCMDIFHPRRSCHREIDGAYFGTGFPHMFFMIYPECRPQFSSKVFTSHVTVRGELVSNGEERLFGFRIHPSAYELQDEARCNSRSRKRKALANGSE